VHGAQALFPLIFDDPLAVCWCPQSPRAVRYTRRLTNRSEDHQEGWTHGPRASHGPFRPRDLFKSVMPTNGKLVSAR
jgi:hypothetical protein